MSVIAHQAVRELFSLRDGMAARDDGWLRGLAEARRLPADGLARPELLARLRLSVNDEIEASRGKRSIHDMPLLPRSPLT